MADDQHEPPSPPRPGPRWHLLAGLHQLAPLRGRPLLVAHAFLMAAASDAELAAAASAHEAQAAQLRDAGLVEALRRAYRTLEPIRLQTGPRLVLLAELLAAAPPELAEQVAAELRAVGLDPAPPWPPRSGPSWPP
jgi:hypothetical protein